MNTRTLTIVSIAAVVLLVVLYESLYRVKQVEQALVLEFGRPVDIVRDPGLHFKKPFVQNVEFYDKRLIQYNLDNKEVIMGDQKWLIVDAYVRYHITDPLKYKQTVRNEITMRDRLDSIVDSSLRQVLGRVPLEKVISDQRSDIMDKIKVIVNSVTSGKPLPKNFTREFIETVEPEAIAPDVSQAAAVPAIPVEEILQEYPGGFGVEVVDVRIMRADLPEENSKFVYRRMITEREREAKEFRAEGKEEADKIRARAEKERAEILAQADKEAEIIRGEADAVATKVFANAFSRDPEFYAFYRSLKAYEKSMDGNDTMMVLSPDSEFLKYMKQGLR